MLDASSALLFRSFFQRRIFQAFIFLSRSTKLLHECALILSSMVLLKREWKGKTGDKDEKDFPSRKDEKQFARSGQFCNLFQFNVTKSVHNAINSSFLSSLNDPNFYQASIATIQCYWNVKIINEGKDSKPTPENTFNVQKVKDCNELIRKRSKFVSIKELFPLSPMFDLTWRAHWIQNNV